MAESYLLDTGAFLKAVIPGQVLGKAAREVMVNDGNRLLLSSLSIIEIGMLVERGRLEMTRREFETGTRDLRVELIAFRVQHTERYLSLPDHREHGDPFDRMLIATALEEGVPIITSDRAFLGYEKLLVIW